MLPDISYLYSSGEPEFYPYLIAKVAKYMPSINDISYATAISEYYSFRITEYKTKDDQYIYLIEDWLDVYKESLEKYNTFVRVRLIHDNTRFPALTWQKLIDAIKNEFWKIVGSDKLTTLATSGFSPRLWAMAEDEVGYKRIDLPEFPPSARILINGDEHVISWFATKETVTVSMSGLTNEYYEEMDKRGYRRVEE